MSADTDPDPDRDPEDEFFDAVENSDEALADKEGAEELAREQEREQREQQQEQATSAVSTQEWLQEETEKDTDEFDFRGRPFEFKKPGVMHKKKMIQLASQTNPEEFNDIDPADTEQVDEALEETFDQEGLEAVDALYDHVLRSLCDLVMDDHLGDTSNLAPGEGAMDSNRLPTGAKRWGQLPEDDVEDDDGNVIKQGVGTLFREVVMQRGEDVAAGNR